MKLIFAFSVALILFAGCKKESHHSVAIYSVDQSSQGVVSVNDAILDDQPIFADREILFYIQEQRPPSLEKDINTTLQNYGADIAFGVTINDQPVY